MLITNEAGYFSFLSKEQYRLLVQDKIDYSSEKGIELKEKFFIFNGSREQFLNNYCNVLRGAKGYLLNSTSLHIFVLTNMCNQQCVYCQAQVENQAGRGMMTKETAKKAVDFALSSPNEYLTFEFQGGEPLINFEVLKYIVEYAEKSKKDKIIRYNIVSNLTLLNDEITKFIIDNRVGVSTSLDGNEILHNNNRPFQNGTGTYGAVVKKIKELQDQGVYVGAIETTTKESFLYYKEIIDTYIEMGMEQIFIRPLTPLGCAASRWNEIGYSPEEFLDFYKKCLDYIIDLNKEGIRIVEGHADIFLKKILKNDGGNYMELRSPCGGVLGQMAYYYDGNIYSCDEGRMLGEMGDDSFKLGNVEDSTYDIISGSRKCKAILSSSLLEALPECCDCVYHPYCGTCPVINYALERDIFPKKPFNYRCRLYKGILKIIFEYLQDDINIDMFLSWIN